jgi:hypothetical protein
VSEAILFSSSPVKFVFLTVAVVLFQKIDTTWQAAAPAGAITEDLKLPQPFPTAKNC